MKYYFRGRMILEYDPKYPREMKTTEDFNMCLFLPEDYKLLQQFFRQAEQHANGEITEDQLNDIEV